MKEIKLTQGKVAIVDDCDYDELIKYRWCFGKVKGHSVGYAIRFVTMDGKRKTILMHRVIMNPKPWEQVDHIGGYGLNNTRENLRLCCHMENHRNMHTHKSNMLGVKGISQPTTKRGYFARITVNYKQIYLGYFQTLEEAKEVRLAAEIKYFGDYRRKNSENIS